MQFQRPVLSQEQRLKMNPQLFQSIQLMALPLQDLTFRIQEELEKNPALEVIEEKQPLSLEEAEAKKKQNDEYEIFQNTSDPGFDPGFTRSYQDGAEDTKRQFLEGALSRPESLQDHLLWQLQLQPVSDRETKIGKLIIRNLDQNGFHIEAPESLVKSSKDLKIMEKMINIIQTFDPVGICVYNYEESLLLQTKMREDAPPKTSEIIKEHLKNLDRGKYSEISKKLKITEEDVLKVLQFIKTLTPFPGALYSNTKVTYVIPDLQVYLKNGQFYIRINDEDIPVLGVNPFFSDLQDQNRKNGKKEIKQFVNGQIKDAKWFINSIHQRNQTLMKVAKAIVEFQRDFFVRGPKYIVPLTLKDIAGEVGVHEATVSRITTNKYVQTEWGIFELKYFFSNSISGSGSSGSKYSKEAVKQIMKEILEEDHGTKRLSDQKISDLLEQRGIKIARRTVAKYRKELDISSSYDR